MFNNSINDKIYNGKSKILLKSVLNKYLPEDFQLEVSSPGIDSPLPHPFQYKKNIGRQLKI